MNVVISKFCLKRNKQCAPFSPLTFISKSRNIIGRENVVQATINHNALLRVEFVDREIFVSADRFVSFGVLNIAVRRLFYHVRQHTIKHWRITLILDLLDC